MATFWEGQELLLYLAQYRQHAFFLSPINKVCRSVWQNIGVMKLKQDEQGGWSELMPIKVIAGPLTVKEALIDGTSKRDKAQIERMCTIRRAYCKQMATRQELSPGSRFPMCPTNEERVPRTPSYDGVGSKARFAFYKYVGTSQSPYNGVAMQAVHDPRSKRNYLYVAEGASHAVKY